MNKKREPQCCEIKSNTYTLETVLLASRRTHIGTHYAVNSVTRLICGSGGLQNVVIIFLLAVYCLRVIGRETLVGVTRFLKAPWRFAFFQISTRYLEHCSIQIISHCGMRFYFTMNGYSVCFPSLDSGENSILNYDEEWEWPLVPTWWKARMHIAGKSVRLPSLEKKRINKEKTIQYLAFMDVQNLGTLY